MVFEVNEEPLPMGWEVAMSRSKNMEYYHNLQTKKVYWVDPELPRGWSHQFDEQGRRFYFHIKNKQNTISYEKPVRRPVYDPKQSNSLPCPPYPAPPSTFNDISYIPKVNTGNDFIDPQSDIFPSNDSISTKRSFDQLTKDEDPTAAAAFYNNLQRNAASTRGDSLVFHMRSMNNWVKSILIHEFSKPNDCILDLACGKGGDLMKWSKRGIRSYMGVDIAQKSLEDAVERFTSSHIHSSDKLDVQFVQGDLGQVSLLQDVLHCWTKEQGWHQAIPLRTTAYFHVVSMQFAFHYMFGDETRAQRFFRTLHEILAPGGIFIATTVDPNKVLHKYYQHSNKKESNVPVDKRQRDVCIMDEKDRVTCTIQFDESIRPLLSGYESINSEGTFGLRYNFTLFESESDDGGSGETAVDLPEYLVPDDLLGRLLKENGFEMLLKQNFHPFILKHIETDRALMERMRVLNFEGTISDAEWEIAGLYQVLAFKKTY